MSERKGSAGPASGIPARGYRWEPFQPGHLLSTRHGANAERFVQPIADAVVRWARERAPWLDDLDGPALESWARAEARCVLLADYLDVHGLVDAEGEPRSALRALERAESSAMRARERLGLDPRSRAALARERADAVLHAADLEQVRAAGREALERVEVVGTARDVEDQEDGS
ncbi:P27 family phage terminase small subunit [Nitriliruptor alkaliphilus]|uniref:P27 family phage terminase small subunit n=1 Tax=Nitriliruptor alkaliphilus TaxID=427918 RepID=UPI000695DB51|nr:P27 family phage terminase small subunit [Nitriliruptor alkaliphilus]